MAKQTVDEKTGDLTVKQALTRAAKANVDRLEVLADFKRLIAPFDGIVTTRNTDVGALINADSSAGLALFVISDTQKLRVNVSVPQNYVPAVKINTKVQITVPEYPGKIYYGVVEASARAVDAQSGTTRMQLVVDNSAGELMPGAFANTRIELPRDRAGAQHPGRRADLRPEGPARGDRGRQQQGRAEAHHHRPRPRPGGRDRHRHRRRPTASSTARPTACRTAIRCGWSRPRRRRRARPRKNPAHGRRAGFVRDMVPSFFQEFGVPPAAAGDERVAEFRCRVTLFGPVES